MTTYEDVMKVLKSDLMKTARDSVEKVQQYSQETNRQQRRANEKDARNMLNELDLETSRQGGLYN
jgi:hypothetical protein